MKTFSIPGGISGPPSACSSAPNRIDVFAVANNATPVWWRGDGTTWTTGRNLDRGRANIPPVPVAAIATSTNDIDIFAVGTDQTPWWWHWNGAAWSLPEQLPNPGGAANLPAERIAAVSPVPG